MRRAAAFAALVSVVGCGLSAVGVDPDGIALTADASSIDPPIDASPIPDATPDAPAFCELQDKPKFCADFTDQPDGVMHATSTDGTLSPVTTTVTIGLGFVLDLDVRFDELPPTGTVSPIDLAPDPANKSAIQFFVGQDKGYFQEFTDDYSDMPAPPSLGVWHHMHVDLTTITIGTRIDARVDDVEYWNGHVLDHPWTNGTSVNFVFGVARLYAATSAKISIDNIVIKTK